MKLRRLFLASAIPTCVALGACGSATTVEPGSGGSVGTGGAASGGSPGTGGSVPATGGKGAGGAGGGGVTGSGGSGSGGTGSGGSGSGGKSTAVSTGGSGSGGVGAGGSGLGGAGTGGRTTGGAGGRPDGGPDAIPGTGGSAMGGTGAGGTGTGTGGRGGTGTGGGGGTGTGGGGAGGAGTWVEDDGTDCTVTGLPSSGLATANAKLPDPFTKLDGKRMTAKAEWHCRREEIKQLGEKFAYGAKGEIPTTTGTVSNTSISVSVSLNGKTSSFSATVSLPKTGTAPYPAVIVYGGMAADTATIQGEGVAIINYDPYQCGKEGTGRTSKSGAYYSIYGSNSTTGLLVAWGWGVSRIIDVLAKSDGKILKADAIGVTGCSRFGKGAIIAGAFDQRVALTMPEESGSAGVPIWRGIPGEGAQSLSSAYGEQPWFGDAFSAFTSAPTKAPLDTHEMVAMVAPRGLFIMDNPHIANLGPKSAHAAALAAAEVYKALGAGDNITYHSNIADGSHCAVRPEWKVPMQQNLRKFLLKTGSDPGAINPSSKATAKASDWIDWTTPTLQ